MKGYGAPELNIKVAYWLWLDTFRFSQELWTAPILPVHKVRP